MECEFYRGQRSALFRQDNAKKDAQKSGSNGTALGRDRTLGMARRSRISLISRGNGKMLI